MVSNRTEVALVLTPCQPDAPRGACASCARFCAAPLSPARLVIDASAIETSLVDCRMWVDKGPEESPPKYPWAGFGFDRAEAGSDLSVYVQVRGADVLG